MLSGEKILITGPAGRIAFGLARSLAADNEVWGIARFSDPATRDKVEALGVTTRTARHRRRRLRRPARPTSPTCCTSPPTSAPTTTTAALRVNAEGTGLRARALPQGEGGAGDVDGHRLQAAPRPVARVPRGRPARRRDGCRRRRRTRSSKIAEEAVARYCARVVRPARSPSPAWARRTATRAASRSGTSTRSRRASRCAPAGIRCRTARSTTTTSARSSSRCSTRPTVPATIVNWGGDEPVSVQEWSRVLRRAARRRGRGGRRRRSRARRSGRSATTPSGPRSPGRARSAGATGSGAMAEHSIPIAWRQR